MVCTLGNLVSVMRGVFDVDKLLVIQALSPSTVDVVLLPTSSVCAGSGNGSNKNSGDRASLYPHLEVTMHPEGVGKVSDELELI